MHPHSHLHLLLLLLILTITSGTSTAQSPPTQNNDPTLQKGNMSSTMSILLIVLISAFIFLAFFSIYIRQCFAMNSTTSFTAPPTRARSIKRHGLNPETLSTFPTLIYSQVKEHNLSKSVLECAVCLNEFEDSETLRLLPNCSHAFHTDCIDAWLAAHVTCPVCRCNLAEPVQNKESVNEHVLIEIEGEDEEERERETNELEKFASVRRSGRHFRSYTIGHAGMVRGEDLERYTLRLPEDVKNAIMLKRTSSCVVFRGEESEKRGFRTTEKLGSFLKRAISMKSGRFLRWDSGKSEGSVRSKGSSLRHVISQFDCCPGSSSSGGGVDSDQLDKVEKLSRTDSSRQKD